MTTEALCYVNHDTAYFTTQPLADQCGDDWDDAPYEYNAGKPYGPLVYYKTTGPEKSVRDWNEDGSPKWTVLEVQFTGDVRRPCEGGGEYSVEQINSGVVPWLSVPFAGLYAGASFAEFLDFIQRAGGIVVTTRSKP